MKTTHSRRRPLAVLSVALIALTLAAASAAALDTGIAAAAGSGGAPIVSVDGGAVRGTVVDGGYAFRGLPYAAAPTGDLRWRPPQPPAAWNGVRDSTQFAPSCPQFSNTMTIVGDEDCLYLNVSTPTLRRNADRPVIVWIHGGGWTQGAG